jgi:hypothetical protein
MRRRDPENRGILLKYQQPDSKTESLPGPTQQPTNSGTVGSQFLTLSHS